MKLSRISSVLKSSTHGSFLVERIQSSLDRVHRVYDKFALFRQNVNNEVFTLPNWILVQTYFLSDMMYCIVLFLGTVDICLSNIFFTLLNRMVFYSSKLVFQVLLQQEILVEDFNYK